MMFMNRLFKRLAVVLTVIGGIVIIWLAVNLVWSQLKISSLRFEGNVLLMFILQLLVLITVKVKLTI